jgi:hypothetical protein
MDYNELRKRFTQFVWDKWIQNNHDLKDISCVYAIIEFSPFQNEPLQSKEIVYVGSTTKLLSRYKSHKIPDIIRGQFGKFCLLFYLPMRKGFYDYEMKLIKKLKPLYNKQHKHNG